MPLPSTKPFNDEYRINDDLKISRTCANNKPTDGTDFIAVLTGQSFELSGADGVTITKLVFKTASSNNGTISATAFTPAGEYNATTKTWTGSSQTVKYAHPTVSGTKQIKLTSVEITYDVVSKLPSPELRFDREVRYGKLGVGVVWEAAKQIGDGVITYTSSDPETVTVNETTGQILPEDVKKAGSVTITASVPATENYRAETADYTVVVQDPGSAVSHGSRTFDFTTKDPYKMTTRSDGKYDTADRTITEGNVSITMKGSHRSYGTSSYDLRFAENASFTITVPNNNEIKGSIEKITINSADTWVINKGNLSLVDGLREWQPKADEGAVSEVTFTNTSSGAKKLKTITVIWKSEQSNLQIANLSFDKTVYNTTVGVETEINKVNNPNNVDAKYSIDCLTEGEYTLNETDGKLSVTVDKVGVYTLRAKSDATDTYLPGMAILRLNVFPALDVKVGEEIAEIENEAIKLPEEGGVVSFGEIPVTVDVYYKATIPGEGEEEVVAFAADEKDGFSYYNGDGIEFNKPGKLEYFMRYGNAYDSPVYAFDVHVGNNTTGIDEIGVDDCNAAVEYFNLQGVRVENPENGLYIRRQGNTVTKVLVK